MSCWDNLKSEVTLVGQWSLGSWLEREVEKSGLGHLKYEIQ